MARIPKCAAAVLAIAMTAPVGVAQAQEPAMGPDDLLPVVIEPTAREFLNSCASCHGTDGKGAGFLTRLFRGVDPGDLTQLSVRNGGTFPLDRVFAVVDGRADIAAHGDRKMPVWGERYMVAAMNERGPDEVNEVHVRNRIYALVHYLQTIQAAEADAED